MGAAKTLTTLASEFAARGIKLAPKRKRGVNGSIAKPQPTPLQENLYKLALASHTHELKKLQKAGFGHTVDAKTDDELVILYALAQLLRDDPDQWLEFCLDATWIGDRKRPRPGAADANKALFFVMRFVIGRGAGASVPTKRAMKRLSAPWRDRMTATEVAEHFWRVREAASTLVLKALPNEQSRKILASHDAFVATMTVCVHKTSRGHRTMSIETLKIEESPDEPMLPL
ncbi:hypothetical protein [Rhizobium leguminosarum]|uniref:hypothetical protein n=1 Tax=Rhizobium leguminosarum TaxID=384 RepID=UPI00143F1CCB|nr:hypothetical protein [Rhizobium leguminosarum]NKL21571.1 hypothetical protein [Rhizobium leguminosarum bv. viciae]